MDIWRYYRFLALCLFNRNLPVLCLIFTPSGVRINPKFYCFEDRWYFSLEGYPLHYGGTCPVGGIPAGTALVGDSGRSLGQGAGGGWLQRLCAPSSQSGPRAGVECACCGVADMVVLSSSSPRRSSLVCPKDNLHMQRMELLSVPVRWRGLFPASRVCLTRTLDAETES